MDFDAFTLTLAEAIDGLDVSSLEEDTPFLDIPQWDSLAVLTCIAMCDMQYQVSLTADEIQACTTLGDLYRMIAGKFK